MEKHALNPLFGWSEQEPRLQMSNHISKKTQKKQAYTILSVSVFRETPKTKKF